tara:strand:+ start:277 stop:1290 length:1014 start_codon:yes stop_codon:yes gene_type:complete
MAGKIGIKIDGKSCFIAIPEAYDKYVAQQIFFSTKRDAGFYGVMTAEEVNEMMLKNGLWSDEEEEKLEGFPKRLENLKVALYEAQMNPKLLKATRKTLDNEKGRFKKLSDKKSIFSNLTRDGSANTLKLQYLLYTSVIDKKGEHIYDGDDFWEDEHKLIEHIFKEYLSAQIEEEIIRELARTEPWRSYWGASKIEGSVFGKSASELTTEQRSLINWSKFYDSINEHMESPDEKVIQDDDLLDGWLIIQNRKSKKEKLEKEIDGKLGKNKGAQEVYVMADSRDHASEINSLNNPMAKRIKNQRERVMDKEGSVSEEQLPDAKQRMRTQAYEQNKARRR